MHETPRLLQSDTLRALGFVHGFTTRHGGVSEGAYSSLNLGGGVGDDASHVRENRRRLADALGVDGVYQTAQVHGAAVHRPAPGDGHDATFEVQADALVAATPGMAVGVRVADCVPVLLADPVTGRAAAVHAGWRGVVADVTGAALAVLGAPGEVDPARVVAVIGPSIGPCCFEVGDDVAAAIAASTRPDVVLRRDGNKPTVDLWLAVEARLRASGVGRVETLGRCTVCEREGFFSYRRDGQRSGRMVGAIVARRS